MFFEWRLAPRGSLDTGILEKEEAPTCLQIDSRVCIYLGSGCSLGPPGNHQGVCDGGSSHAKPS